MYKTLIGIVIAATLVYSGIKQITTGKMDGAKRIMQSIRQSQWKRHQKLPVFCIFR